MTFERPQFLIDHDRMERPTEVFVPLVEGICPVWNHPGQRGVWEAYVATAIKGYEFGDDANDGLIVECGHEHPDQEEAWECAASLSLRVARHVVRQ